MPGRRFTVVGTEFKLDRVDAIGLVAAIGPDDMASCEPSLLAPGEWVRVHGPSRLLQKSCQTLFASMSRLTISFLQLLYGQAMTGAAKHGGGGRALTMKIDQQACSVFFSNPVD